MTPVDPNVPVPAPAAKSWLPTRKWVAAEVAALGTLAVMLLTGNRDVLSDEETVAIIGFIVQAIGTYIVPNKDVDAVGGVPVKGSGV